MKKTTNKIVELLKQSYNLKDFEKVVEDKKENSKSFYVLYKTKSIRFCDVGSNAFGAYVTGEIYSGEMSALISLLKEVNTNEK